MWPIFYHLTPHFPAKNFLYINPLNSFPVQVYRIVILCSFICGGIFTKPVCKMFANFLSLLYTDVCYLAYNISIFEISQHICRLFSYIAIYQQFILFIQFYVKQRYPMFNFGIFLMYTKNRVFIQYKHEFLSFSYLFWMKFLFNDWKNKETTYFVLEKMIL